MATATFDRTFVISNTESKQKLLKILDSGKSEKTHPVASFSEDKRKRSEELLKQFLSRSNG